MPWFFSSRAYTVLGETHATYQLWFLSFPCNWIKMKLCDTGCSCGMCFRDLSMSSAKYSWFCLLYSCTLLFNSRIISLRKNISHCFQLLPKVWKGQIYERLTECPNWEMNRDTWRLRQCVLPDSAKRVGIPFHLNPWAATHTDSHLFAHSASVQNLYLLTHHHWN